MGQSIWVDHNFTGKLYVYWKLAGASRENFYAELLDFGGAQADNIFVLVVPFVVIFLVLLVVIFLVLLVVIFPVLLVVIFPVLLVAVFAVLLVARQLGFNSDRTKP